MNATTNVDADGATTTTISLKKEEEKEVGLFSKEMADRCGQAARSGVFTASHIIGAAAPTIIGAALISYGLDALFGE